MTNARIAGGAAADRPELWLPGALAWIATAGWLLFVLAVARLPTQGDLTFFGGRLRTAEAWPLNAIAIGVAIVAVAVFLAWIAAFGETALQRRLISTGADGLGPTLRAATRLTAVFGVAALPATLVAIAMGLRLAAVAPDEFQSPDIGGDLTVRLLAHAAPFVAPLVVTILGGQAWGAAAARRVTLGAPVGEAMRSAFADLRRGGGRLTPIAIGSMLATVAYAVAVLMLLDVLWAPIASRLSEGSAIAAEGTPLLIGFIAIWLCLVLGGGAVHAWVSTWWSLELADVRDVSQPTTNEGARTA